LLSLLACRWMGEEAKWKTYEKVISNDDGESLVRVACCVSLSSFSAAMRAYCLAEKSMARLNRTAAGLMHKYSELARAALFALHRELLCCRGACGHGCDRVRHSWYAPVPYG
jgi:hypothetical protein